MATTAGPGVVATIYSDNLAIISPTSAAVHRWACRFKPLPAARRPLLGHHHRLRRHRTVSTDQLEHISPTPAATAPVGLLLQSAFNRPGVIVIVGNLATFLQPIPATSPSSSLRKMLTPTPRAPQASPLAHFKGLLLINACVYMYAVEHAHFTAIRHLLQPTILSYCRLVFFRQKPPTASSATHPSSLVLAQSSSARSMDHHPSPALLPHLPRTPRRHCLAIGSLQHSLVRPPAAFHRIFR